ncbi:MAG: hypothetical protein AAGK05_17215, partial [Pseudomonadota bacterium]
GLQFTEQELNAVIGVIVASGCLPLPRRRTFWSSDDLQINLAISCATSRNKFESIFTKLHSVENSDMCASTLGYVELLKHATRFDKKLKKRIVIDCPYAVHLYNQTMGGVDRSDQNISHGS